MPDAEYAGIDDKVLLELIELAGFLETEVEAARFPEYRFRRYSDALDKLIHDEVIALGCDPEDLAAMQRAADAGVVADRPRRPAGRPPFHRP